MMHKLKSGDLPDPPTYDSIVKSTIKYKIKRSVTSFNKKTKKIVKQVKLISVYLLKLILALLTSIYFKINKKINILSNYDWEKITYVGSFILIILFLIFSFTPFLIADNDNSTYLCDGGDSCEKVGVNSSDCDITSYGTTCSQICTNWNIGGSGDSQGYPIGGATLCCGDDALENYEYRQCYSGTTAGTFCSNSTSDDACCDATTDCIYNNVCYTASNSGIDLDASGEADAVCQSQTTYGRWVDCDKNSTLCSYCDSGTDLPSCSGTDCFVISGESSGHGEYSPGETECCGDDSNENYRTREVNETNIDNGYSDDSNDKACCDASTDCVNSSVCFTSGLSNMSVDGDTDNDYCLNGEWVDCNSDSDCSYGYICNSDENDCVNVNGFIRIRNLGTTGVENTNQEYTSTKTVMLSLNFTVNATKCRYTNYPNNNELPPQSYIEWTSWESCISNRIWSLSDGSGVKTVFYQIEYPISNITFNDTINYNYSGYGLDLTPPSSVYVYHNNYTNDNQSITIYWTAATDPESDIFGIPLRYNVSLFDENHNLLANASTTNLQYPFVLEEGHIQPHGSKLYANVTIINSANLTNNATSNYLVIDLIGPNMTAVNGEAFNYSASDYQTINDEDSWFYSDNINLSWTAFDTNSSIYAYSYYLSKSYQEPDDVPEGTIGQLHELIDTIYSNLDSGKYYFTIKARDMAGNWGPESSINFSVDSTPPTTPVILTKTRNGNNYTFTWSESNDPESDISKYMLILNASGIRVNATINDTSNRTFTFYNLAINDQYNITAGSKNGAGIWSWDLVKKQSLDTTPPVIIAMPNTSVITSYPILRAWTNEQAVCEYSLTSSPNEKTIFRYTNTSYHETKLNYSIDADYDYTITCTDLSDNTATKTITFSVNSTVEPANISITNPLNTYENTKKTINFKIMDSDENLLSGLLNQDFSFKLNDKNHPYSVFDNGNGHYNLTYDAPDYGSYTMLIELDNGVNNLSIFNITKLGFYVIYNDSEITISNYDSHLSYAISDTNIGLATEDDLESGYEITRQNNKLNISGSDIKNSIMIFNTKSGVSLNDRNKKISKNQFLNLVNPSFGYPITEEYYILYKLAYKNFDIKGEDNLNLGKYDISILNTVEDDKTVIRFEKTTDNDKVVLTSG